MSYQQIPFRTEQDLIQRKLPLPDREITSQQLAELGQVAPYRGGNPALDGYHYFYGLDKIFQMPVLEDYYQGYLSVNPYRIHVQCFFPHAPTSTSILIHGYLEHSALYQPLVGELLEQGSSVIMFDLPGHGLSTGRPASINDFIEYQYILAQLGDVLRQHFASRCPSPWLGIGQSTGGAIWLDHTFRSNLRRQLPLVRRLLLLSPLIRPARTSWWHNTVGLSLVKLIRKDVPRAFRRNNYNPEYLRFVRKHDPLQPRRMGMDWIIAMTRWIEWMEHQARCRTLVWVAQGANDQTVDWNFNIQFIREHFRLHTYLLLEEGSHQLVNERKDIRTALTALIPAFVHYRD